MSRQRISLIATRSLGVAIEKACTLARKAWGSANVGQGVAAIADQVCGYEDDVSARLD